MKSTRRYKNPQNFYTVEKKLWPNGCAKDHKTGIVFCWWLHNGNLFCPYGCEEVEE